MCAGVVPQQPPTMFTQPSSRKRLQLEGQAGRRLAVLAALVGQAGVGIDAHERRGQRGQRAQVVGHELGTGRAVEPDRARARGARATPHSASTPWPASMVPVGSIVALTISGSVDAGLLQRLAHAERGGLDVERVLAGLEQQRVRAAGDEPGRLHAIAGAHVVERHVAGDGDRPRRGPHGADHEARRRPPRGPGGPPRARSRTRGRPGRTRRARRARSRRCWWRRSRRRRRR